MSQSTSSDVLEIKTSHKVKRIGKNTLQYKLDAVNAKGLNNTKAAEKFKVNQKRIIEWKKHKDQLKLTDKRRKHLEGAGRKPLADTLEEELLLWITERRSAGLQVSRKIIVARAKNIYPEKEDRSNVEFHASNGWVKKKL